MVDIESGKFVRYLYPDDIAAIEEGGEGVAKGSRHFYAAKKANRDYGKFGSFYWCTIDGWRPIFPDCSPSSLPYIFFVGTYLNRDGTLTYGRGTYYPLRVKWLAKQLGVAPQNIYGLVSKERTGGILTVEGGGHLSLSTDCFSYDAPKRKAVRTASRRNQLVLRVFRDGIRRLIVQTPQGERSRLQYVFKLLPYLNVSYNVVCRNPYEMELEKIIPLSLREISDACGLKSFSRKRFVKILSSPLLSGDFGKEFVVSILSAESSPFGEECCIINPRIAYGGARASEVLSIGNFDLNERMGFDKEDT